MKKSWPTMLLLAGVFAACTPPKSINEEDGPEKIAAHTFDIRGTKVSLEEDTSIEFDVSIAAAGATDLTIEVDSKPTNGTLVKVSGTRYRYTPEPDFNGNDQALFYGATGTVKSDKAGVLFSVTSVLDVPVMADQSFQLLEDGLLDGQLLATLVEPEPAIFEVVTQPGDGTLILNADGAFSYIPDANFYGSDFFECKVVQGGVSTTPATRIQLTVAPVNDAPVVGNAVTVVTDQNMPVALQAQASDGEADPLVFALSTAPLHGSVAVTAATGQMVYTPTPGYSGNDTFTYVANDGVLDSVAGSVFVAIHKDAIFSMSPVSGPGGLPVTLTGDFGASGTLRFDGQALATTQWTPTTIVFVPPVDSHPGSHAIVIENDTVSIPELFVITPWIDQVSPLLVGPSISTTILGQGFGDTQGTVTADDVSATIVSWTNGVIEFVVPASVGSGRRNLSMATSTGLKSNVGFMLVHGSDLWLPLDQMPHRRTDHSSIWTGTEMIVWGGFHGDGSVGHHFDTGWSYNPATDSWTPISTVGAPLGRRGHSAIWTGSKMIIWGGRAYNSGVTYMNTGGQYAPDTDSWQATTVVNAPSGRYGFSTVWTGSEMIVWGGYASGSAVKTGGRYNPEADTWQATSLVNAPFQRDNHTAIWTGENMIVWPGYSFGGGAKYYPTQDTWSEISDIGQPSDRAGHTAVWTGNAMLIWGGRNGDGSGYPTSGGKYYPASDTWSTLPLSNAPAGRKEHSAVWADNAWLIWGGRDEAGTYLSSGARYDLALNTWSTLPAAGLSARGEHSAVWTGAEMLVWGGSTDAEEQVSTGARYAVQFNTWSAIGMDFVPDGRRTYKSTWTGSEMLLFDVDATISTKAQSVRYNATTLQWAPMSNTGHPVNGSGASVVWTGQQMIVWGGLTTAFVNLNTGSRYDPAIDSWSATTAAGAPLGRNSHTATWAGSRMIIWGGSNATNSSTWTFLNTGSRYNPATNNWLATTTTGAPAGRERHVAVGVDDKMLVWGGSTGISAVYLDDGSQYDVVSNSWTAMASTGSPTARRGMTSVWTGTEWIIWGGANGTSALGTGARYKLSDNTWAAVSNSGAPIARFGHVAVWTGQEMIVWGGNTVLDYFATQNRLASGGIYDPSLNTWAPMSLTNTPTARKFSHAAWTGTEMLILMGDDKNLTPDSSFSYSP